MKRADDELRRAAGRIASGKDEGALTDVLLVNHEGFMLYYSAHARREGQTAIAVRAAGNTTVIAAWLRPILDLTVRSLARSPSVGVWYVVSSDRPSC